MPKSLPPTAVQGDWSKESSLIWLTMQLVDQLIYREDNDKHYPTNPDIPAKSPNVAIDLGDLWKVKIWFPELILSSQVEKTP